MPLPSPPRHIHSRGSAEMGAGQQRMVEKKGTRSRRKIDLTRFSYNNSKCLLESKAGEIYGGGANRARGLIGYMCFNLLIPPVA